MSPRELPRPRRRAQRALAVRMLAAKVEWLDGRLRWHDGRVVWKSRGGTTAPGAADLARAQRCLNRIGRYPIAAGIVFGDSKAWLQQRRARLELAKQLSAISADDLPSLARRAQDRDADAIRRLVTLLVPEALCSNPLPAAPSAALAACGERAEKPLRAVLDDESLPPACRALAALTLGALHRAARSMEARLDPPILTDAWLRRAYGWGVTSGLPSDPPLISALLADSDGMALARRCVSVLASRCPLRLPAPLLRELLDDGTPPRRVVALAEAAASAEPLSASLVRGSDELSDRPPPRRPWRPEPRPAVGHQAVATLAELLHEYARATVDPAVVHLAMRFMDAMLAMGSSRPVLAEAATLALRAGQELSPELRRPYLELLVERHAQLWDRSKLPAGDRKDREAGRLHSWLQTQWSREVRPMLTVLRRTKDVEIARQGLELGIHRVLARYEWQEAARYRWLVMLARDLCTPGDSALVWTLASVLETVSDLQAARSLLRPIVQAVLPVPLWLREHFLEALFHEVPNTRQGLRDTLPRLVRFFPRLVRFAEADPSTTCACGTTIAAALALDCAVPEQADGWLEWLLSYLADPARTSDRTYEHGQSLEIGVPLAVALAGRDLLRFQAIVSAAWQHRFRQDGEMIRRSLPVLERFPGLRAPLALLFPQQPQRCAELLVRVGLATRLGPEALSPLDALRDDTSRLHVIESATAPATASGPAWSEVLALAPELASARASYEHAQRLLHGAGSVPPGVRRVLEVPRRLTNELAYLEHRLESEPSRSDLAARVVSLRARLANTARLKALMREEIRERLTQITAEAQIAAAEQQVLLCYRGRLEAVVGPLPADLSFDADLVNATLLTVDSSRNRRLLLRLLRAHLAGERAWRERHPANVAFLASLAARRVDTTAWLASHPRSYRCLGAAGGRVRLSLEHDPLAILQMGNLFETCLSLGDINAFSTVANACELNKRVLYARDGAGRVVGRKLIGINADGCLIGFHTYTTLPDESGNGALRAIVRRFLGDFAARCGLRLSDEGTVPTLFAEAWYDDGVVPWDAEEPPTPRGETQQRHRAGELGGTGPRTPNRETNRAVSEEPP